MVGREKTDGILQVVFSREAASGEAVIGGDAASGEAVIGGEAASGGAGIGGAAVIGGAAMEANEEAALGYKPHDGPVAWGTTANGKS